MQNLSTKPYPAPLFMITTIHNAMIKHRQRIIGETRVSLKSGAGCSLLRPLGLRRTITRPRGQ